MPRANAEGLLCWSPWLQDCQPLQLSPVLVSPVQGPASFPPMGAC